MDFCLLLKLHHKGHKRRSFHEPPKKNASASKSSKSSKHLEKSTKIIKSPSNLDLFQPFPYVFFKGSRLGHASLELCHMQPQGRAVGLRSVAELRHQAAQGAVHRCGLRGQQLQMQILRDMKQLQVYHYVCVLYMV